jgi:hypothetical protein
MALRRGSISGGCFQLAEILASPLFSRVYCCPVAKTRRPERSTEMGRTVNQRQFLAQKLETLNDAEVCEVLDYISAMETKREARHRSRSVSPVWEDEVLSVLAEALENQRARQAFEWEAVRRKAEKRAAARVGAHL